MKTFMDNKGRTWTLNINISTVKRVKSLLKVNLLGALEDKLIEKLSSDPVLLCDIIYVICKPEADAAGITDEDFGAAMAGNAISDATAAMLEELVEFFPEDERRPMKMALEKWRGVKQKAVELAVTYINSPELDDKLNMIMNNCIDSFGSLRGSSGSTPGL